MMGILGGVYRIRKSLPDNEYGINARDKVYHHLAPANAAPRFEPRTNWPTRRRGGEPSVRTALIVTYYEGRRQLPILQLRQAA